MACRTDGAARAAIDARLGALKRAGVRDGHLRERTLDELDACAAALVAHAMAQGRAAYAGHRDEGVIGLPGPLRPDGHPPISEQPPRVPLPT